MTQPTALKPKLRFPEFRNGPDWNETTLGAVAHLKNGYAFRSSEYVGEGPFQILTIANVQQGRLDLDSTKRIAQLPSDIQSHQILHTGDILISMTGNVGRICLVTCEGLLLNQRVGKLVPHLIDQRFFYQLLQRDDFRNTMQLRAAGGAQGNLSSGDISEYLFSQPASRAEQQKSAECLSTLDELIGAESQKLDALKAHKKGLMQQLFPREGETLPRLRFPEFHSAPEWNVSTIQKLIDENHIVGHLDGNHGELYPRAEEFASSGVPYITANDFADGFVRFNRCRFLPEERALQFRKGVAKDGDVLFAHNATVGPVAKLSTDLKFVILSTTATYFRCDPKFLSSDFLKAALSSPVFVGQYSRVMAQSTRNQVPITAQRKFFLQIPGPAEQHRIATCLSSLDELIAAQSDRLTALQTHKQGLLQQLFPSPTDANV